MLIAKWENPCRWEGERLDFGHLGGTALTGDPNSWFPELWDWLRTTFSIKSMLDVGCGVGFAQKFFAEQGLFSYGVDCEQVLEHHLLGPAFREAHDLTLSRWEAPLDTFDLVWCCEVAEHIEERFVHNVVQTVARNCHKVLAFCAAPVGAGGYHHVNCQDPQYWIEKIEVAGLTYDPNLTVQARRLCPEAYGRSRDNYFLRSGLIFTRK